jgi:hypothetical protein
MAEPFRRPTPRPPHPHAAAVRSRRLTEPEDPDATLPPRPVLRAVPKPADSPPTPVPAAAFAAPSAPPRVAGERRSRHFLVTALALHLGALLLGGLGPAPHLGAADLVLSASVLLGGGIMLFLARGLERGPGTR